ncbi:MAG: ECF transporter S component [Acidimicrobiia bacterium]|nr:ECF transporter S component [Acidimicrobiia bacterium]
MTPTSQLARRRGREVPSWLLYGAIVVVGIAAFLYPFWLPAEAAPVEAHRTVAPLVAAALVGLVVVTIGVEVHRHRMNGATIALLGVLSASAGLLRIVDLPGGGSGMFFLVILAGAAFGPRFGLLLGLSAMALSALITGGWVRWPPFQMLGLAVDGGHLGLRRSCGRPACRLASRSRVLALFAWAWGFAYGAILNLWSWPFAIGDGPMAWNPSLTLGETLAHYWRFYVTTSFAWDAAGALTNAVARGRDRDRRPADAAALRRPPRPGHRDGAARNDT